MFHARPAFALLATVALTSQPLAADPMALGAASNFSQGWNEQTFTAATQLGVRQFRDSIRWADVERTRGVYTFGPRRTQYPDSLAAVGAHLVLTVSGSNPLYDNGQTPHSPAAVAAFARFVGAVVERYPAIAAVEVGNEFNGSDFVTGPVRADGLRQRARYHLALVRAVAAEVRAERPELPVLGGATHSIPAGYLWDVLEGTGPGLMDGLAIHPYTTPIDQLPVQIEVLRRNAAARDLPLYVTEWGTPEEALAADHMLRGYAAMASLGFAALDWYPLNERGDGMVPLVRRDGSVTSAGEAFRFITARLAQLDARDVSPDAFTFAHQFGDNALVLWGEPRVVRLGRADITAFDARGQRLDGQALTLAADRALVLIGEEPIRLGEDIMLGCISLIADSFYQFAYPANSAARTEFSGQARIGHTRQGLVTLPGQQRNSVPWVPYLGLPDNPGFRLTADSLLLGGNQRGAGGDIALAQHWRAPLGGELRLEARVTPAARNAAALAFRITQGGRSLFATSSTAPMRFEGALTAGEVEFAVARTAAGPAAAAYRWRVHDDSRCPQSQTVDAPVEDSR